MTPLSDEKAHTPGWVAAVSRLPGRVIGRLTRRAQRALLHMTRVTNDGYPQPPGSIPPAGPAPAGRQPDTELP